MEQWRQEKRGDAVIVDIEALVPKAHLLRKIERIMDYDWLYERLSPLYCHDNGRNGTDPVVLVKMVLLQHLYGIPMPSASGFRRSSPARYLSTSSTKR